MFGGYLYCTGGEAAETYYAPLSPSGLVSWTQTTSYPFPFFGQSCVTALGNIYCVAGDDENLGKPSLTSYFAPISSPSPGIGGWSQTTSYGHFAGSAGPQVFQFTGSPIVNAVLDATDVRGARRLSCGSDDNNYIYCVGGEISFFKPKLGTFDSSTYIDFPSDQVLYAQLTPAGIGDWKFANYYRNAQTSGSIENQSCVAHKGYMYCVGGTGGNPLSPSDTAEVWYAPLLGANGVGTWTQTTSYGGGAVANHSCTIVLDNLVCIGDRNGLGSTTAQSNQVWSAPLLTPAGVGPWTLQLGYPLDPISNSACASTSSRVYCVGGQGPGAYVVDSSFFTSFSSSIELKDAASCSEIGAWDSSTSSCKISSNLSLDLAVTIDVQPGVTLAVGDVNTCAPSPSRDCADPLTITNNGIVNLEFGASFVNFGTLINNGTIDNGGTFTNRGLLQNFGQFLTTGLSQKQTGTFTNLNQVTNSGFFAADSAHQNGNVTVEVNGTTCQNSSSEIASDSQYMIYGSWNSGVCQLNPFSGLPQFVVEPHIVAQNVTWQIPLGVTLHNLNELDVFGEVDNFGTFINEPESSPFGAGLLLVFNDFKNSGNLIDQNGGITSVVGTLENSGGIALKSSGSILDIGGTMTNTNTSKVNIDPGASLLVEGMIDNFGSIFNSGTVSTHGVLASIASQGGGAIFNQGNGKTNGTGGTITTTVGATIVDLNSASCANLGGGWSSFSQKCVVALGQTAVINATTLLRIGAGVTLDNFGTIDILGGVDQFGSLVNQAFTTVNVAYLGALKVESGAVLSNYSLVSDSGTVNNLGSIKNVCGGRLDQSQGVFDGVSIVTIPCGSSPLEPVYITLTAAPNPAAANQNVTLTANAQRQDATGMVTFFDAATPLGQAPLSIAGNGSAAAAISVVLTAGTHSLTASYSGDNTHAQATSDPVTLDVASGPAFAGPIAVATGDFNGDGKVDLAVVNQNGNTVSVLLGNGDGSFQAPTAYPVGNVPLSVAVGDFNGDGKPDLAIVNSADSTISVLLGNGDGTFQPQVVWDGSGSLTLPLFVAAADLNKDGKDDLIVANSGSTVAVLMAQTSGTFPSASLFRVGLQPTSIAVGDLNGDGNLDLATANSLSNNVSVLFGNGAGGFGPPVTYGAGFLSNPRSIVMGDFNGDGKLDLAVANRTAGPGSLTVLLNAGNGTFPTAQNYTTGNGPTAVAAGDFNGDGVLDLFVANSSDNNVSVYFGKGDGTFSAVGTRATGANPRSIAAADFNGDGVADFVATNFNDNTLTIVLGANTTLRPVTVNTSPTGESFNVDGATYVDTHTFQWVPGSQHTISTSQQQSAGPRARFQFNGWSDGGAISHVITTPASGSTYTAQFTAQYQLVTSVTPPGGGSIVASPSSPDGYYNGGTLVQFTATPTNGFGFDSWTSGFSGTVNPQSLTINAPPTLAANFTQTEGVTVKSAPAGLSLVVDGVTYTGSQTFNWLIGSSHSISTASPQSSAPGTQYVFGNWSDGGAQSHMVTVPASATTYTASFATQYQLTTSVSPAGAGTVTPSSSWYNHGDVVNLSATANSGYVFASWAGTVTTPASASTNIVMTGPLSAIATFQSGGGSPALLLSITGKSGPQNARVWTVGIKNNGAGAATGVQLNGLTLIQTIGAACTPVVNSSFPLNAGNVAPGVSTSVPLTIDFSSCSGGVYFTAKIPFSSNSGTVSGTLQLAKQNP